MQNDGDVSTRVQSSDVGAFHFQARDLHLVLGPAPDGKPIRFRVRLDAGIIARETGDGS